MLHDIKISKKSTILSKVIKLIKWESEYKLKDDYRIKVWPPLYITSGHQTRHESVSVWVRDHRSVLKV
jgi:hypothetical protein